MREHIWKAPHHGSPCTLPRSVLYRSPSSSSSRSISTTSISTSSSSSGVFTTQEGGGGDENVHEEISTGAPDVTYRKEPVTFYRKDITRMSALRRMVEKDVGDAQAWVAMWCTALQDGWIGWHPPSTRASCEEDHAGWEAWLDHPTPSTSTSAGCGIQASCAFFPVSVLIGPPRWHPGRRSTRVVSTRMGTRRCPLLRKKNIPHTSPLHQREGEGSRSGDSMVAFTTSEERRNVFSSTLTPPFRTSPRSLVTPLVEGSTMGYRKEEAPGIPHSTSPPVSLFSREESTSSEDLSTLFFKTTSAEVAHEWRKHKKNKKKEEGNTKNEEEDYFSVTVRLTRPASWLWFSTACGATEGHVGDVERVTRTAVSPIMNTAKNGLPPDGPSLSLFVPTTTTTNSRSSSHHMKEKEAMPSTGPRVDTNLPPRSAGKMPLHPSDTFPTNRGGGGDRTCSFSQGLCRALTREFPDRFVTCYVEARFSFSYVEGRCGMRCTWYPAAPASSSTFSNSTPTPLSGVSFDGGGGGVARCKKEAMHRKNISRRGHRLAEEDEDCSGSVERHTSSYSVSLSSPHHSLDLDVHAPRTSRFLHQGRCSSEGEEDVHYAPEETQHHKRKKSHQTSRKTSKRRERRGRCSTEEEKEDDTSREKPRLHERRRHEQTWKPHPRASHFRRTHCGTEEEAMRSVGADGAYPFPTGRLGGKKGAVLEGVEDTTISVKNWPFPSLVDPSRTSEEDGDVDGVLPLSSSSSSHARIPHEKGRRDATGHDGTCSPFFMTTTSIPEVSFQTVQRLFRTLPTPSPPAAVNVSLLLRGRRHGAHVTDEEKEEEEEDPRRAKRRNPTREAAHDHEYSKRDTGKNGEEEEKKKKGTGERSRRFPPGKTSHSSSSFLSPTTSTFSGSSCSSLLHASPYSALEGSGAAETSSFVKDLAHLVQALVRLELDVQDLTGSPAMVHPPFPPLFSPPRTPALSFETKTMDASTTTTATASHWNHPVPLLSARPFGGVFLPHGGLLLWGSYKPSPKPHNMDEDPHPKEKEVLPGSGVNDNEKESLTWCTPTAGRPPPPSSSSVVRWSSGRESWYFLTTDSFHPLQRGEKKGEGMTTTRLQWLPSLLWPSLVLTSGRMTEEKKEVTKMESLPCSSSLLPQRDHDGEESQKERRAENTNRTEVPRGPKEEEEEAAEEEETPPVLQYSLAYYPWCLSMLCQHTACPVVPFSPMIPLISWKPPPQEKKKRSIRLHRTPTKMEETVRRVAASVAAAVATGVSWLFHVRLYRGGRISEALRYTATHLCRALHLVEETHMVLALSTLAESIVPPSASTTMMATTGLASLDAMTMTGIEWVLWPALEEVLHTLLARRLPFLAGVLLINVALPLILQEPVEGAGGTSALSRSSIPSEHRRGEQGRREEEREGGRGVSSFSSSSSSSRGSFALPRFTRWCNAYQAVSFVERVLWGLAWWLRRSCAIAAGMGGRGRGRTDLTAGREKKKNEKEVKKKCISYSTPNEEAEEKEPSRTGRKKGGRNPLVAMMSASLGRIIAMEGEARVVRQALESMHLPSSCVCSRLPPRGNAFFSSWCGTPVQEGRGILGDDVVPGHIDMVQGVVGMGHLRDARPHGSRGIRVEEERSGRDVLVKKTVCHRWLGRPSPCWPPLQKCAICGTSMGEVPLAYTLEKEEEQEEEEGDKMDRSRTIKEHTMQSAEEARTSRTRRVTVPQKGSLGLQCMYCGHGGHVDHIMKWWQRSDAFQCPQGCGCRCRY